MNQSLTAVKRSGTGAGIAAFSSVLVLSELFTENLSVRDFSILLAT